MRKNLRRCEDEIDNQKEINIDQKQQFLEDLQKQKEKVLAYKDQNAKLKIKVEEVQQEKSTIMRKLVQTMLKYEKETSFNHQVSLFQQTEYKPNKDYISIDACDGQDSKMLAIASKSSMRRNRESSQKSHAKSEYNYVDSKNISFAYPYEVGNKTGKREIER